MNDGVPQPVRDVIGLPRGLLGRPMPVPMPGAMFAAFDPRNIDGCVAWFDASDLSTFTFNYANSPTTVSVWRNKAGADTLRQTTSASQPSLTTHNGLTALSFVSKSMSSSLAASAWSFLHNGTQQFDIYMVARSFVRSVFGSGWLATFNTNNANVGFLWGHGGGASAQQMGASVSGGGSAYVATSQVNLDSPTQVQQNMLVFGLYADLNNGIAGDRLRTFASNGRVSGAASNTNTAPSSSAPQQTLTVGYSANGVLCEVLIYARQNNLTPSERVDLTNYLVKKWGIV